LVATYPFLSDEWVAEARAIRQELRSEPAPPISPIRMNQNVTDVPFGPGTIQTHLDTSSGELELEFGHLDDADVTVTLEYATAKAILVEGNPQIGMQALMAGKIKVEGDWSKLMALQTIAANPDPAAIAIARRIQQITE
jgi:putative sterol carrier protein